MINRHDDRDKSGKLEAVDKEDLEKVFGGFENATLQALAKKGEFPKLRTSGTFARHKHAHPPHNTRSDNFAKTDYNDAEFRDPDV
ncbi:MAG: hypothetical protein LBH37_04115 [Oscillospiraceae bacterium]|jgi:hypothetical protein|nr:hypothetical protein [Oscillospiraceae bacterium]